MLDIWSLLIALLVLIIVFLAIRTLVLWYWKVNEIRAAQDKTNTLLTAILQELQIGKGGTSV